MTGGSSCFSEEDPCRTLLRASRNGDFVRAWAMIITITSELEQNSSVHIDATDGDGESALSLAAAFGQVRILNALVDKGANHQHCPNEQTPIPLVRVSGAFICDSRFCNLPVWRSYS